MMRPVPVLLYHHVAPFVGESLTVTPTGFEKHLRMLRDEGFTPVPLRVLRDYFAGHRLTGERPVVITFDDGYLDNWIFAFPILERLAVPVTIFIVTGWLSEQPGVRGAGTPVLRRSIVRQMAEAGQQTSVTFSWSEAREMLASGLIDIQSHTVSHTCCDPPENGIEWEEIRSSFPELKSQAQPSTLERLGEEFAFSKQIIEEQTGRACHALAWPWGIYGPQSVNLAIASGYDCLCTIRPGGNRTEADLLALRRVMIATEDPAWLRRRLRVFSQPNLLRLFSLYRQLRRLALWMRGTRNVLERKYRFRLT